MCIDSISVCVDLWKKAKGKGLKANSKGLRAKSLVTCFQQAGPSLILSPITPLLTGSGGGVGSPAVYHLLHIGGDFGIEGELLARGGVDKAQRLGV